MGWVRGFCLDVGEQVHALLARHAGTESFGGGGADEIGMPARVSRHRKVPPAPVHRL